MRGTPHVHVRRATHAQRKAYLDLRYDSLQADVDTAIYITSSTCSKNQATDSAWARPTTAGTHLQTDGCCVDR
jgi:hypothetical protein